MMQAPPTPDITNEQGDDRAAAPAACAQSVDDRPPPGVPAAAGPPPVCELGPMQVAAAAPLAPLSWRLRAWRRGVPGRECSGGGGREVAGGGQAVLPPSSPPTTPARRRRRTEMEPQTSIQTPLGKRCRGIAGLPPPTPDATGEDRARRLQKRRAAIAAIKGMPEYSACTAGRLSGVLKEEEVPLTPEADDSTLSKRQWEAAVQQWRSLLKRMVLPGCVDLDSAN
mmetsp:Transcript_89186/g.277282  ORF Transcript_89186/g.277282 Transcript_89186/m.277282 type:complete len:225 (-) Transcript_89186:36-710(-)